MDIVKIQKLNDMAQHLRKHNVVYTQESAVTQAEKIYGKDNNFSSTQQKAEYESDDVNELRKDVRRLTFALQKAVMEINGLKTDVSRLSKELNDVRVNQRPARKIEHPHMQHNQAVPEQKSVHISPDPIQQPTAPQAVPEQKPATQEPDKPIDRNGIAPSSVSIEKIFYFGQK